MTAASVAPGTVYLHTMGCPKNDADSRSLSRALIAAGLRMVDEPSEGAHILINTCGFIQEAKEESIGAILDACSRYGGERVIVMGCLVERYRDELRSGIPEVGGWFGQGEAERLVTFLREETGGAPSPATDGAAPVRTSYAYLKISDGCDESCTFCAIPGIKGSYYSVPAENILAEANAVLAEGVRELVLVGQDTAAWSQDDLSLTGLVDRLAADERVRRIRLMYLQPEHVGDDLLAHMAGSAKLCRYLDIPFQHADREVLRRMGRWGGGEEYLELLARARRVMPDVSVRSTFIVGFPGETEEQFETLLEFVSAAGFDHAGGFVYSPEENTPAASLKPKVRRPVARERLARLTSLLATEAERRQRRLLESQVEVIIDSLDAAELEEGLTAVGRIPGQAPEIDGVTYVQGELPAGSGPGDIVTVRVTETMGYDLVGRHEAS